MKLNLHHRIKRIPPEGAMTYHYMKLEGKFTQGGIIMIVSTKTSVR